MQVATTVDAVQAEITRWRAAGQRIAFVPTMGNLHAGHLHLMQVARQHANRVVASIYVNPLQFGPQEDFAAYPRTPEQDRALLEQQDVDLLFVPDDATIYPRGREASTRVEVPGISDILCGASRPGHFRGVTTVVSRLFHLVTPDVAVFGKKDYQQLLIIRLMTSDLGLPITIVGEETVREADGLAMSSRNGYLTGPERGVAPRLSATLQGVATLLASTGATTPDFTALEKEASQLLKAAGFRPDYVSIRRQQDLGLPVPGDRKLVILAAAWLGRTRLIDNREVELKPGT